MVDALKLFWMPLTALLVGWLLSLTPVHQRWSDAVDDGLLSATARESRFEDVVVVDFDDAALIELRPQLGAWPFKRDIYAVLVDFLREAGARLVVFDIVFGETREGDQAFAELIGKGQDVILGAAAMTDRLEDQVPADKLKRLSIAQSDASVFISWPAMKLPTAPLRDRLAGLGSIGIITTPLAEDGYLRRLPMLHEIDGRVFPSLPLAVVLREFGEVAAGLHTIRSELRLGKHAWPVDDQGMARLALPANVERLPSVGADKLIAAALGASDSAAIKAKLRGRAVFIGSSAFLGDRVITSSGQLTGVAVLATTYDSLRRDDLIRGAPWYITVAMLLAALLPGLLVVRRGRSEISRDAPIALVATAIVGICATLLLTTQKMQLSPLVAWTIIVIGFLLTAVQQVRATSRANRELREQRLAAEVANSAKSEFLAGVSHELRTPLHAVLGMADVLSQTRLDADQRRYVEVFRNAGSSLASLIDDLLDLSRIEASQVTLDVLPFVLQDLLNSLKELMEPRAKAKGLGLELNVDASAGTVVRGDAKRLMQILLNLIGNAIKFTPSGSITISVDRQPQGLLHVQVRDTGIGIAQSKQHLIFEPFTQADGSITRTYGGTGLGLSITRQLVELMGGTIWIESAPGLGSSFHFTADIRIAEQPVDTVERGVLVPPAARPPTDAVGGVRILLVEDNEVNVIVVEAMLQGSGHQLDVAPNGEAAIEMFRGTDYGLVLMDVHMPGMNGYDATREIRAIEAATGREPTAVLALSASAFESDRQASVAAGCNGHLAKPLSRQHLLDAIVTHGRPASDSIGTTTRAEDVFDQQAALLQAGGDETRRQRNFEHARVFLAGWQPLFNAARAGSDHQLQSALCKDLHRVALGVGAHGVALEASRLAEMLATDSPGDLDAAIGSVMHQLQRAVAAMTLARP